MWNRKLILFSTIFLTLLGISTFIWIKGRPTAPSYNPLANVDVEKIKQIKIENQTSSITLEKGTTTWMVVSPLRDLADPVIVDRIVVGLKAFSVGSNVSENENNYGTYLLKKDQASHVLVYIQGQDLPALDMYVGKTFSGSSDSFIRFEGAKPVYIANGLPNFIFRGETKSFRMRKIWNVNLNEATYINVDMEKNHYRFYRSSTTWFDEQRTVPMDPSWQTILTDHFERTMAYDFVSSTQPAKDLGEEKPFLKISIEFPTYSVSGFIGNKVVLSSATPNIAAGSRYAISSERDVIMVVYQQFVDDLISFFKPTK